MVTRVARADGASYLGPFRSSAAAHRAREAIEDAVPLRRCGTRIGRKAALDVRAAVRARAARRRDVPVPRAGRARTRTPSSPTPCAAACDDDPALLCAPLEARMHRLAEAERFEEAAATRDRLATLTQALQRQRAMDALRGAERLVIDSDEGRVVLAHGRVVLDDTDVALVDVERRRASRPRRSRRRAPRPTSSCS